jgi:hypothetical protein
VWRDLKLVSETSAHTQSPGLKNLRASFSRHFSIPSVVLFRIDTLRVYLFRYVSVFSFDSAWPLYADILLVDVMESLIYGESVTLNACPHLLSSQFITD